MIAGLLGVWLVDGVDDLPSELFGGCEGNPGILLKLDDDLRGDIRGYHIPKTKTLSRLMGEYFSDALGVSFIGNETSVELPEIAGSEHVKRLKELPGGIEHRGTPVLHYHNGVRRM